jgi:preprotein translocase subunit YajC
MDQGVSSLIFLVLLIGIFYFMLIRPQRRRVQQHQQLVQSLDVGDEIVTIGGLHGTIATIGDDDLQVEVAPGVKLRFVKSAVARVVVENLDADEEEEEEEDDAAEPKTTAAVEDDKQ